MTFADQSPSLTKAIFQRIHASVEPPEAQNKALECFAIYWLIIDGTTAGDTVTTGTLRRQTRLTSTALIALAKRLETLGLITRAQVTAIHGKGRAWAYHPVLPPDFALLALGGEQDRIVSPAR
ncbi:hypothetical protein MicloDRAFT_00031280 [Microvirga lotononidis]|uniref:Transcriptional regulator n=1 Tax=Microvirga lotononidis TaxID=864069 RepID=I4YRI7_9HYPH|nr:hypothetical protein MicloDRAFT_00031280 [Microvirga lotononidis]